MFQCSAVCLSMWVAGVGDWPHLRIFGQRLAFTLELGGRLQVRRAFSNVWARERMPTWHLPIALLPAIGGAIQRRAQRADDCVYPPPPPTDLKARDTLAKLVPLETATTAQLLEVCESKHALFFSIDRSWAVEIALLEALNGKEGDRLVIRSLTQLFPSASRPGNVDKCLQDVRALKIGALGRSTGAGATSTLKAVEEVLDGMVRGVSPDLRHMTSPGMVALANLWPFFCSELGADDQLLSGAAALARKMQVATEQHTAGTLSLAELDAIQPFEFMMSAAQKTLMESFVQSAIAGVKKATTATASRGSKRTRAPTSAEKQADKAAKSAAAAEADVMGLFD